ncbi:MAG: Fic family protein [Nanoarchaeota archaeon]|nr:Fic family protein [Nanoarchaeota archaeon]
MATKYDCFEFIYKNKSSLKPIEVVRNFNKENYATILKQLNELVKERLLAKTPQGFQIEISEKTSLLHIIIEYCIKNEINYNLLLDKNFIRFIKESLGKKEITSKNIKINPRTLKKYILILEKYGMIIVISEKPIKAEIFYNTLLNNLLVYFDFKRLDLNKKPINYIKEIEKELALFKKSRKNNETKYKTILEDFQASFIYHSLSLEGNPITLQNTIKILKQEIIPADLRAIDIEEIKNYQEAIRQMLKDANEKKLLNIQSILEYHKIAMKHRISLAGTIRKIPVFIKGNQDFKTTEHSKIKEELEKLIQEYNILLIKNKLSIKELLNFAVYFHNEFQHIHPFEDGNSRTTRLITFYIFQQQDIPILDIPFGLLDEYLANTKGSKKREDENLNQTLQKIILFNLKKINKMLRY